MMTTIRRETANDYICFMFPARPKPRYAPHTNKIRSWRRHRGAVLSRVRVLVTRPTPLCPAATISRSCAVVGFRVMATGLSPSTLAAALFAGCPPPRKLCDGLSTSTSPGLLSYSPRMPRRPRAVEHDEVANPRNSWSFTSTTDFRINKRRYAYGYGQSRKRKRGRNPMADGTTSYSRFRWWKDDPLVA
ncbi:hypothetical protein LX32DRAFT_113312 [Colletotrichum zoysiae]|uniref:Uncharacterized protein n=1 Tax=Colletotrichum zoysiae TaxID=1216348 RepID=A0AAD9H9D2_9PEZI|nr:hypothetical protein LX32DRAFT_113312 [Colletotrichum zoysiae]